MPFPGAGRIVRRFGITLACVLAARGCANEIEAYVREKNTPVVSRATPAMIAGELVPYGTPSARVPDIPSLERTLDEVRYAP